MASDRPYQRAMSLDQIIVELKRGSGTHFDPAIAEVFIRIAEREGDRLLINSAQEVTRKQARSNGTPASIARLLQLGSERM